MSYQEKKTLVSILSGILVFGAYFYYTYGKYQSGAIALDDLKFWAITMLIFIGIGIAATIVIQIVFHILLSIGIAIKEKACEKEYSDKEIERKIELEMVEDEMVKLVERKASSFSLGFIGVGFIIALVALVLNYSPTVMLNILFISFFVGSICDGVAQFYFYKRGIKNG